MKGVIFILIFSIQISYAVITIQNNRYKGIVVAIHNSVAEDPKIVQNLKELFTTASEALFKVSRNRSYFDDIAIVVPAEWTHQQDYTQTVSGNRFEVADFRVDNPNPLYGDVPYTLQADSCGKSGQYVHLTPTFIQGLNDNSRNQFGDPAKALVHEWAHYRYGVFDEYSDPNDAQTRPFYLDVQNNIHVTGCSENIRGWLADEGQPCRIGEDGLPDENCRFYPDFDNENGHSSLMYMHYLPTMEGFCDDTEELKHNAIAPSKQNVICGGKSTWSVVSSHPDFLNDNNPPRSDLNPKPKFRVLHPKRNDGGHFVLVLDVSGSMSGSRISMLHRAAVRFVETQIPDKSQLGIVTFSTVPRIIKDLTPINNQTRRDFASRIPTKDDEGNTAIGQGLQLAIKLLADRQATEGGVIILISDGEENVQPYIHDILPEILSSRVTINTIAFGSEASRQLEKLIRLTGGHGFFFSDDDIMQNKVASLQAAFFAAVSTQADVELQPVELNNRIIDIPTHNERRGKIVVDEAIGKNTRFVFTASEPDKLELALKSPSKILHNNRSKTFLPDYDNGAATFSIPMAEVGKWEYRIKNNHYQAQVVGVSVTSEPKEIKKQPIRIKAWISDVQFDYLSNAKEAKIFAEVKKKYTPIIGATVVALVERPFGDHVEIQLHDNGAGADVTKNDGVYSSYFTQFRGSGRYSVAARVVNDGNARIRVKKIGRPKQGALMVNRFDPTAVSDLPKPKMLFSPNDLEMPKEMSNNDYEDDDIYQFERTKLAGAFVLDGWKDDKKDVIPPNRVIDLRVEHLPIYQKQVVLLWTMAGDDRDSGVANWTDIRIHTQAIDIYQDFESGYQITDKDIVNGTLYPANGGEIRVVIELPNITMPNVTVHTLFFALRSYDEAQNQGEISNIAQANFYIPQEEIERKMSFSQLVLIITCSVVISLTVIIIILLSIRVCRNKTYKAKAYI